MMEEEPGAPDEAAETKGEENPVVDEAVEVELHLNTAVLENQMVIRTLDGEIAGDELEGDAINYQILLRKLDDLLNRLNLDA